MSEGMFDSDSAASEFCVTSLFEDRQKAILGFFAAKLPPPNARFESLNSQNLLELEQVEANLLFYGFRSLMAFVGLGYTQNTNCWIAHNFSLIVCTQALPE